MSLRCLPSSFGSIGPMVWEMLFDEFQDGRHGGRLGYLNGTILAILNLCVTVMLSIKFGRRCRLKNFMVVILDTGTEQL